MGGKDYILAWTGHRLSLLAGDPAEYFFWYSPGLVEPIDLGLSHVGAHPGPACIRIQVYAGRMGGGAPARAASFLPLVTGSLGRTTGNFFRLGEVFLEPICSLNNREFFPGRSCGALAMVSAGGEFRKGIL
jgi:hypothetical protein